MFVSSPTRVGVQWLSVPPLPIEWEDAFHDARNEVRPYGILVLEDLGNNYGTADLVICAYAAASHMEDLVGTILEKMREAQLQRPELRLAVAACGPTEHPLAEAEVMTWLCMDGNFARRHAQRVHHSSDLVTEAAKWFTVTAKGNFAPGTDLGPGRDPYDSETLIARANQDPENPMWLGQI